MINLKVYITIFFCIHISNSLQINSVHSLEYVTVTIIFSGRAIIYVVGLVLHTRAQVSSGLSLNFFKQLGNKIETLNLPKEEYNTIWMGQGHNGMRIICKWTYSVGGLRVFYLKKGDLSGNSGADTVQGEDPVSVFPAFSRSAFDGSSIQELEGDRFIRSVQSSVRGLMKTQDPSSFVLRGLFCLPFSLESY